MAVALFRPEESGPHTLTVGDVVALYQRHALADGVHGPEARADRDRTFRLFCAEFGHLPIADARAYHLRDFIAAHPEWRSTATRRQKSNSIRAAFNWALRDERIERNPFANVRYDEAERRPAIEDRDLDRVLVAANKATERILRFLRLTGCRVSEAINATWADVDLERGIWTIHKHKTRKHTKRPKVVALVGEAVRLLKDIAITQNASPRRPDMPLGGVPTVAAKLFLNTRGRPWSRPNLYMALQRFKAATGCQTRGGVHAIRHQFATVAVANGAPVALVAAQLGHSDSRTTERYYCHLENHLDAIRAAAELSVPKK